jgi:hypothetical protein
MSTPVESAVARALDARAEGTVDVARLRSTAMVRARRIRLRRRVLGCVAAVVALVAGIGLTTTWATGGRDRPAQEHTEYVPPPALPLVAAPAAGAAPERVATDPSVIHFDVDPIALRATELTWRSGPDVESVAVRTEETGRFTVYVQLARSLGALQSSYWGLDGENPRGWYPPRPEDGPWRDLTSYTPEQLSGPNGYAQLQVPGAPGAVTRWPDPTGGDRARYLVTWSPTDGLWVQVQVAATGPEALVDAIRALRLDRSQACRVPGVVRGAPADLTWVECETSLRADRPFWEHSVITFGGRLGGLVDVMFGNLAVADPFVSNRSVGGRPARAFMQPSGGPAIEVPGGRGRQLFVSNRTGRFTEDDVMRLAGGFAFTGDAKDIETWPGRPVP